NVEGAGMIGVPGTADRLFGALHRADVSVILISQASSEHSICFAVPEALAEEAREAVREAFAVELEEGQIQKVELTAGQSIIAVVGDGMSGVPGIAGRFLNTLGRAGINVSAIAQGSSERNISVVVDRPDSTRALRAVHSGFYLSAKTISIGVIGPGTVGGTFLDQLAAQAGQLRERFNLDLRVRAVAGSRHMLTGERRIDLSRWRESLAGGAATDLDAVIDHIDADHLPHTVVIDCTADAGIAARYGDWLKRGVHVITPNKKAFSAPFAEYQALAAAARAGSSHYLYETTVGAGLPIIRTLRDLIETGDRVERVEGIFSGTLAYLFNTFDGSRPFSAIVREARDNGYTEPDPRDDLSGMDVARKVTILARELGNPVELDSLSVQSLVPAALRDGSVDDFLERLPDYDDEMQAMIQRAAANGRRLRYVGRLDAAGGPQVQLLEVDRDHPFANINLTDNVVQFVTARYAANPLVVQGPGAGPDVTAGGVFGDLLRLASILTGQD
ncbi:MAG: ACT domain-containing protein, partial [Pseudomonadota bacterium]